MGASDEADDGSPSAMRGGLIGWLRNPRKSLGYVRLRGDLATERREFEALVAQLDDAAEPVWERTVEELFDLADAALERGHVEDAWQHFHGARRVETYGLEALDDQDEAAGALRARARAVREEALQAVSGWRRRAVEDLLGRAELADDVSGADVRTASWLLHKHHEGVHRKRRSLQAQFRQLFYLGLSFGAVFLVLSTLEAFVPADPPGAMTATAAFLEPPFPPAPNATATAPDVGRPGFAVFVGLSGVIGAAVFGMRSLKDQMLSADVPQRIPTAVLTSARLLFGAVSALFSYFVIQTPFVSGIDEHTAAVMIVVGFAAGYSERMVAPAVETVASVSGSRDPS